MQRCDAGRKVRSEYQVFRHRKLTSILQSESDPDPAEEEREEVSEVLRIWRESSPSEFVMGRFSVVRERSSRSLEKVGRFHVEREMVVIYLDGIGTFQVGRAQVISVVLRLGDEVIWDQDGGTVGVINLSGSGKGVKMVVKEKLYVAPVRRVKRVLEGKEKKGAMFEVK